MVVAIILLFIGIALSPIITAVDIDTEADDEPIDNSEIGEWDNYREILSSLECGCASVTFRGLLGWIGIDGYYISLFRHAEIYADGNDRIRITGYKFPTLDNPNIDFSFYARRVIAPFFIGYYLVVSPGCEAVEGIALGNIKWLEYE